MYAHGSGSDAELLADRLGRIALEHQFDDFGFPGRWYAIGHGQLHLIQGDAPGGSLDPSGPHFAIAVEDLEAARRELASAGVETLDPGGAQLWLRDPDGNVIELTSAPL